MNEHATQVDDDDDDEDEGFMPAASTDNVGEASVEIHVDDLVSELEAAGLPTAHIHGASARKRLEELMEQKRVWRELMDFEDFDLDD